MGDYFWLAMAAVFFGSILAQTRVGEWCFWLCYGWFIIPIRTVYRLLTGYYRRGDGGSGSGAEHTPTAAVTLDIRPTRVDIR